MATTHRQKLTATQYRGKFSCWMATTLFPNTLLSRYQPDWHWVAGLARSGGLGLGLRVAGTVTVVVPATVAARRPRRAGALARPWLSRSHCHSRPQAQWRPSPAGQGPPGSESDWLESPWPWLWRVTVAVMVPWTWRPGRAAWPARVPARARPAAESGSDSLHRDRHRPGRAVTVAQAARPGRGARVTVPYGTLGHAI